MILKKIRYKKLVEDLPKHSVAATQTPSVQVFAIVCRTADAYVDGIPLVELRFLLESIACGVALALLPEIWGLQLLLHMRTGKDHSSFGINTL